MMNSTIMKDWKITKDVSFTTSRGIGSETTIAFQDQDVICVNDDGNGMFPTVNNLTDKNFISQFVAEYRNATCNNVDYIGDYSDDCLVINNFIMQNI